MYNLSKQFELFMKNNDKYWNGKENYRIQEEYKKLLKKNPVTTTEWVSPTITNDTRLHIIAVDI